MSLEEMEAVMCMTGHPWETDHLCTEAPGHPLPHICDGCHITWSDESNL